MESEQTNNGGDQSRASQQVGVSSGELGRTAESEHRRQLNESLKARLMDLAPWAEHCSVFAYCVRDVAGANGGDWETALFKTLDKVVEAGSCRRPTGGDERSAPATRALDTDPKI